MRNFLSGVGLILFVPGGMALLSLPIALFFEEYYGVEALVITAAVSLSSGGFLRYGRSNLRTSFSVAEMMGIATVGWILVTVLGALPFFYLAHRLPADQVTTHQLAPFASFLNAAFESLSGYTSTGLSVTISESSLPAVLQWWRSFLQWVGGIGIIVFISALHPGIASVSAHYSSDNDGKEDEEDKQQDEQEENDDQDEVLPNTEVSWAKIWWIYLGFTFLAIGLLWMQDIPLWEAINHGMTAISTGGFSITDQSLNHYAWGPKLVVILMIILGSLNFHSFHQLFAKGAVRRFVNNQQHQLFFVLLLVGTLLVFYENNIWANGTASWIDLAFQFSSALGTCGFSTVSVQDWSVPTLLVLTAAMLIGGATASTTGGIKLFRVILLVKGNLYGVLSWMKDPGGELNLRFNHQVFSHDESLRLYRNMGVFSFFWTGMFLLTTIVLLHEVPAQYGLADVLFEAASALGTVGLSVGITSHELSALAKLDLMLAMLVGRLELMPLVIVLAKALRA